MHTATDTAWFLVALSILSALVLVTTGYIYSRLYKRLRRRWIEQHPSERVKNSWQKGAGWVALDVVMLLFTFLTVTVLLSCALSFVFFILASMGVDLLPNNGVAIMLLTILSVVGAFLVMVFMYVRFRQRIVRRKNL